MNLTAVMDELAEKARVIDGLKAFEWPAPKVPVPSLVITYPETLMYGRPVGGPNRLTINAMLMIARADTRQARDVATAYCAEDGPGSIPAALNSSSTVEYDSCDVVTVTDVTFDVVTMGGIDYLAALFALDIVGG